MIDGPQQPERPDPEPAWISPEEPGNEPPPPAGPPPPPAATPDWDALADRAAAENRRRKILLLAGGGVGIAAAVACIVAFCPSGSGHKAAGPSTSQKRAANGVMALPACAASDLSLRLRSAQAVYQPKDYPQFRLTLENTGKRDCRVDLGPTATTVTVTSSEQEHVWSSGDCPSEREARWTRLTADKPVTENYDWERTRSKPACASASGGAPGDGTYTATAGLRSLTVSTTFRLTAASPSATPSTPPPTTSAPATPSRSAPPTTKAPQVEVPQLLGKTLQEARQALAAKGLTLALGEGSSNRPDARVIAQSPGSGAGVARGSRVTVTALQFGGNGGGDGGFIGGKGD